uniref:Uncharacterized protein n=1 Tax=Plectus sambesii TaxID=2011161 RepID=A0A914W5B7_9BILA
MSDTTVDKPEDVVATESNEAPSADKPDQTADVAAEKAEATPVVEHQPMDTTDPAPSAAAEEVSQPEPASDDSAKPDIAALNQTQPEAKESGGGDAALQQAAAQSIPTRQYLDQTVVPILLQALSALAKERPPNPIDYLANYLMKEKERFTAAGEAAGQ